MHTASNAKPSPDTAHTPAPTPPYFTLTDFTFVVMALLVGALVLRLGATTWTEGMHTEATKAQGERLAAWIAQAGERRAAGEKTGIGACDDENTVWKDCRDALIAADGPLANLTNVAYPGGPVFTATCDRTRRETLGGLLVQEGLPKPPDGAALNYNPISDDKSVREPLPLRIAACGRGYSQINLRDVKF